MRFKTLALAGVLWTSTIVAGQGWLLEKSTRGSHAVSDADWPSDSSISLDPDKFTLLLFVHPRCACTKATLYELDRLMTRHADNLAGCVAFSMADEFDTELQRGKNTLWDQASLIPQVSKHKDFGNRECKRFAVDASGTALLFSPEGSLRFAGGLTSSKGHCGISAGIQAIDMILAQPAAEAIRTPIYGCSLVAPRM